MTHAHTDGPGSRSRTPPVRLLDSPLSGARSQVCRWWRHQGAEIRPPWRARRRACRTRRSEAPRLDRRGPRRLRCSRTSCREMLDVQETLKDPVVEAGLTELIAVEDRVHSLPTLLQKREERPVGGVRIELLDALQDAGGPVDTETSLARPHAEAKSASEVVEVGCASPFHRVDKRRL